MRPFLHFSLLIVLVASLASCQKVIDIDVPPTDPKIVVNSFFTGGSKIKAHVSKSIGILENIIPVCTDATVVLRENNVVLDTMYYQSGYYYSHIVAQTNRKYSIEVIVPDMETVISEDLIPERTILQNYACTDSVLIDEDGFVINELRLEFDDLPGPSFYEVELSAKYVADDNLTSIWFMKNSDPVITSAGLLDYNPKSLIFNDRMFDGKHCQVKIYFATQAFDDYNLRITFRSVSESYYRYKERQVVYLFSLENDIFGGMGEPVNLYSNITGGFGIFAAYSTDERIITISGK